MISLREDQSETIGRLRQSLRDHQFTLLRAATGWGKSVSAAHMVKGIADAHKRVLILCHRRELAWQLSRTLGWFGIDHGFIIGGMGRTGARVQIASAQALARKPALAACDWVIVDEAHLWASATREALLFRIKETGARGVGLSATPERLDGKPLAIFDNLVEGPQERWLIEHGHLSDYRAFAPVRPDLTGMHVRMGEYVTAEAEEKLDRPSITGDAVGHYLKLARGLRCLVFAVSRQHGEHLTDAYRSAGVPAEYIDGETDDRERRTRILRFARDGGVLVNIQLCVEGFDLSSYVGREVPIEAVSLQNPTTSLARAMQMIGRVLRPKPCPAVIMDHVNILTTHGFPDEPRSWSLEGRLARTSKPTDGALPVRICESCFGAFRPAPVCPYCGAVQSITPREVLQVEGELAEVDRDLQRAQAQREVQRARTLADLARIAVERGYRPGWIIAKMKARGQPATWPVVEAAVRAARVSA